MGSPGASVSLLLPGAGTGTCNTAAVGCWDGRLRLVHLPSVSASTAKAGATTNAARVLSWHATHVHALAATSEDPAAARLGDLVTTTQGSQQEDENDLISDLMAWQAPATESRPVLLASASQDGRIALWQVH
jgi:hypothetical protein